MIVKRTINGATVRYVEVLEGLYSAPRREDYATEALWQAALLADQERAFAVDSGLTYDGVATTTITGLDHLEGETVKVWANGGTHPDVVVSSGSISLDYEVTFAHVGLGYTWQYGSLKLPYGARAGTAVGKVKRLHEVGFVLDGASTFEMGANRSDMDVVEFREVADAMDTGEPLFTGEKTQEFNGGYGRDERIYLKGSNPAPWTCLALLPELKTNDIR